MKLTRISFVAAMMVAVAAGCCRQHGGDTPLPRATEQEKSAFSAQEFDFVGDTVNSFACNELHGMMVLKDGKVVYEKYYDGHTADEEHILWSASKTFTATGVGFAVQDGLLSLDDKMVKFLDPEDIPDTTAWSAEQKAWMDSVTVKQLLIMSSGLQKDLIGRCRSREDFNWTREALKEGFMFCPGSTWDYNSMNTYILSEIVTKVTGKRLDEYLDEKLFAPLGIRQYYWDVSPQGYNAGGWGLHMRLESLAKMGQFMLQGGVWDGKRLLNEEWLHQAMTPQIIQPYGSHPEHMAGYGYQMWCGAHGAARIMGAWCQVCYIYPDKNAVVAIFSHCGSEGLMFDAIAKHAYNQL